MPNQQLAELAFEGRPYLLRVSELSDILGISRASVYRLVERGDLQATRPMLSGSRGSVRVLRDSAQQLLLRWLEAEATAEPTA